MIALLLEAIFAYIVLAFIEAMNGELGASVEVLPLLLLLVAEYFGEIRYLRKERSKRSFYCLNAAFFLVNTAVMYFFARQDYFLIAVASLILIVRLPKLVYQKVNEREMMMHFETSILLAILYFLVMEAGRDLPLSGSICAVFAPILAMFALNAMRSGKVGKGLAANTIKSPGTWVACGILGILLLWAMLLQSSVESVSKGAVRVGACVLSFLYQVFYNFAFWLSQFMPKYTESLIEEEIDGGMGEMSSAGSEGLDWSVLLPYLKLLALFLVLVVFVRLLLHARGQKTDLMKAVKTGRFGADEKREGEGLLARILFELRFELFYRKNAGNVLGSYIWLLRFGKRHGMEKSEGESLREYLERAAAAASAGNHTHLQGNLLKMADALDAYFYGGKAGREPLPEPEKGFREEIRKMLQNQPTEQAD